MRSLLFPLLLLGCLCSFFLFACDNKTTTEPSSTDVVVADSLPSTPPLIERQVSGLPVVLVVRTAMATVYERPDFSAALVTNYQQGDSLLFTNRVTETYSNKTLEGLTYQEPWLRIILPNEKMAWVYGAHVQFDAQAQPALAKLVLYPRVAALFGNNLAQQIGIYQQEASGIRTLPGFRTLYTRAQHIKDTLELRLANYARANTAASTADFFWLNELLEGLLLHHVPEQNKHYLFRDLTHWKNISLQTPSMVDDHFMELLLACYPADSIAYYYYGWQLPLDEQRFCSLLGSGIHSDVLTQIDSAIDTSSYFRPEINQIKQALIDDIATNRNFWMPLPAVQNELDSILKKNYAFLNSGDRVALKTKRAFLKAPQDHQLVLNLFEKG
jgi:hypothetical protein